MSWETSAVSIITFCALLFGYLSMNVRFPKGFRMMFVFMSFLLILVAINQARVITEDAVNDPDLDRLISITHASLIYFFLTLTSIFLTIELVLLIQRINVKKKTSGNT